MRMGVLTAVVGAVVLAGLVRAQPLRLAPEMLPMVLAPFVQPGASVGTIRQRTPPAFRHLDANGDGRVDAADLALHDASYLAAVRAAAASRMMQADLDGDGFVTEAELATKLAFEQRLLDGPRRAQVERQRAESLRQWTAADKDGDRRVSWSEAAAAVPQRPAATFPGTAQVGGLLAAVGRTGGALTEEEFTTLVETAVRTVDTDGNGTISQEEFAAYQRQASEVRRRSAPTQAGPACNLPRASEAAEVMLISGYEGDALSTATIGSQDVVTRTAAIHVAPGRQPLYLVLATHTPTIWRFTGAVDRLERVVLSSNRAAAPQAAPLVGAVGLSADRVTFVARVNCLRYFSELPSGQAAVAAAVVRAETGKEPGVVAGRYAISLVDLASGTFRSAAPPPSEEIIREWAGSPGSDAPAGTAAIAAVRREFDRFYGGGLVRIDPAQTVSSLPAAPYEVLPAQAGLMQLLMRGALGTNGSREFLIRERIRFPAGLHGGHSVRFLLLRGVPVPEGSPGHSCVISEETGATTNGGPRC
ncbi:MAG: EF-hand domain-containing protein [Phreatobacter sp.]|uniref:EF-hand domain-containing protein n=1 Tax=Phreatobacter sp. TaxID=1966341 RepID=UPI004036EEF5